MSVPSQQQGGSHGGAAQQQQGQSPAPAKPIIRDWAAI